MKIFRFIFLLICVYSCSKKETIPNNIEVQNFIWKGLNAYYLWQDKVPNLFDRRFSSQEQLNKFSTQYENPYNLFQTLLYKKNTVDKWSWIFKDYTVLEKALEGTNTTHGMKFGIARFKNDKSKVFGYVRYVVPNTDAQVKHIKRGMIFTRVNGSVLTTSNYEKLLFSNTNSYTIDLADYNFGNPISNGNSITLTKSEYTENPVYITKIFTQGSKKIGYLMYNGFISSFNDQLNLAFGEFKAQHVSDLIVDLRYNSGGSVKTATYLASMITGQFNTKLFSKEKWNSKVQKKLSQNNFTNIIDNGTTKKPINSLYLNSIYFITTRSSASASEMVINGLTPYIKVKKVGTKTSGKYVGSVTLYDSTNFTKRQINKNHKWAMQPIVFEVVNKNGENNKNGFEPDYLLNEDYGNLGVLGNKNEPLLARTIELITTGITVTSRSFNTENNSSLEIDDSNLHTYTSNNMYVEFK